MNQEQHNPFLPSVVAPTGPRLVWLSIFDQPLLWVYGAGLEKHERNIAFLRAAPTIILLGLLLWIIPAFLFSMLSFFNGDKYSDFGSIYLPRLLLQTHELLITSFWSFATPAIAVIALGPIFLWRCPRCPLVGLLAGLLIVLAFMAPAWACFAIGAESMIHDSVSTPLTVSMAVFLFAFAYTLNISDRDEFALGTSSLWTWYIWSGIALAIVSSIVFSFGSNLATSIWVGTATLFAWMAGALRIPIWVAHVMYSLFRMDLRHNPYLHLITNEPQPT